MRVADLSLYKSNVPTSVTIGVFDGVHLGHQKILDKLCKVALKTGTTSTLLTFSEHPRIVLEQNKNLKLLNTVKEKISILSQSPLNQIVIAPFDQSFAALDAETFIKTILVDILHVRTIIVGYDHRFGKNRSSSLEDLIKYGHHYNFDVEIIPAKESNSIPISSTKIRLALQEGNIELANKYLGYPFMLSGIVVAGKKIGHASLGFPTANIDIDPSKIVPKDGVYIVLCHIDHKTHYGMMSIGNNPTFKNIQKSIEVHLLNFNETIYGKEICVEILSHLRGQVAFPSIESLKNQLYKDREATQKFIENIK